MQENPELPTSGNSPEDGDAAYSKPKISIYWLLFAGLLGFIAACLLMFNRYVFFHDVDFNPKKIAIGLLGKKQSELVNQMPDKNDLVLQRDILSKKIQNCRTHAIIYNCKQNGKSVFDYPDTSELLLFDQYMIVKDEIHRIKYLNDTSFNRQLFLSSLFTNKDSLSLIYKTMHLINRPLRAVLFEYLHDSSKSSLSIESMDSVKLIDVDYAGRTINFFSKYPNFGIWVLIVVFQIVAAFIIIPISLMTMLALKNSLASSLDIKDNAYLKDILISFISVAIFVITFKCTIYTKHLIGNSFFMQNYSCINNMYQYLDYLTAVLTLAGFLYTARMLQKMLSNISDKAGKHKRLLVKKLNLESNVSLENAALPVALHSVNSSIDNSASELSDLKDQYDKVKKHFSIFFGASAFLLSMVVIETGALLSAINSLDLVRFINANSSAYFIRSDFVYLFGAVYSLLLLIFYIPVKISMINLRTNIPDLNVDGQGNLNWLSSFSSGFKTFAGIITASSPLLVGIIQYFVSSFSR